MRIEILNWDRFNIRKDIKATNWLRFQNNFCTDPDFWSFTSDEKMVWIYILCESSQRYKKEISIDLQQISAFMRIKLSCVENGMSKLVQLGAIKKISGGFTDHVTSESNLASATNRQTNKQTITSECLNLDDAYGRYPKKEGKTRGLLKLNQTIKTQDQLNLFLLAIENYKIKLNNEGTKKQFIKQFSTFVNCWEDYLELEKTDLDEQHDRIKNIFEANEKRGQQNG